MPKRKAEDVLNEILREVEFTDPKVNDLVTELKGRVGAMQYIVDVFIRGLFPWSVGVEPSEQDAADMSAALIAYDPTLGGLLAEMERDERGL